MLTNILSFVNIYRTYDGDSGLSQIHICNAGRNKFEGSNYPLRYLTPMVVDYLMLDADAFHLNNAGYARFTMVCAALLQQKHFSSCFV